MRLSNAVDAYLEDLATRKRKSPKTVATYRTALNRLVAHLGDLDVGDLDGNEVIEYARALGGEDIASSTLSLYLTAVSQFYKWLMLEEVIVLPTSQYERLAARLADQRKGRKKLRLPRTPNEKGVQALRTVAQTPAKGAPTTAQAAQRMRLTRKRDAVLLHVLRSTGARVAEVADLLREDVNLAQKRAKVLGKGDAERVVFLDEEAVKAIQEYLDMRDSANLRRPADTEALISRHDKKSGWQVLPMNPNSIRMRLKAMAKEAGVEYITPHQFRHRLGAKAIGTLGLREVQKLLGHASVTTTQIYTHVEDEALANGHAGLAL